MKTRGLHQLAAAHLIDDGVLHPRAKLAGIGLVYLLVAWQTLTYPPGYLVLPALWSALAAIGGLAALVALTRSRRIFAVIAGTATITGAAARGIALIGELLLDPPAADEARASFAIGAAVWLLVALLLWQAFVLVIIPWTTRRPAPAAC